MADKESEPGPDDKPEPGSQDYVARTMPACFMLLATLVHFATSRYRL